MEELPKKAKAVMGIYATASALAQGTALFLGFKTEDYIVLFVALGVALTVGTYVYVVLYFKNYRYSVSDSVIIIKKGALFKRRHLVYVEKISTVTVYESFLHRWFDLCTVVFHVQGSTVRLSFVEVEKSVKLQEILDSRD